MKDPASSYISRKPLFTGATVFLLLLFLTQYLAFQRYQIIQDANSTELQQELNSVKDRIKTALAYGLSATKTLAFIIENYGEPADFDSLAREILESNKNIDALELTRGGTITHIYPLQGNESAIGYNVLNDSLRNKQAYTAIEKGELYFDGPIVLRQGGIGFVGRLPIYKGENFYGFSVVLIRLSTFLNAAGIDTLRNTRFVYQLSKIERETQKEEFFVKGANSSQKRQSTYINVQDGEWKLSASLKKNNAARIASIISILGTLLSILGGLFAHSIAHQPLKLKRLVDEKTLQLSASEKHFRSMIEKSADAIILMNKDGKVHYQSPSAQKITGYSFAETQKMERTDVIHPDDREGDGFVFNYLLSEPGVTLRRNHRMKHKDGHYIWIEGTYTNLLHDEDVNAIVYNYYDVTLRIESEQRAEHANRLYEFISRVNRAMITIQEETRLFQEVCSIAVSCGKFKMAWIGKVDWEKQELLPVAHGSEEKNLPFEKKAISLHNPSFLLAPTGKAILQGQPIFCNNIKKDPNMQVWLGEALIRGFQSCISLPIKKFDKVTGVFSLYAPETDYFNPKEISLLEEIVADITFALESQENDKLRREAEHEVLQVYKDKVTTLNRISDSVISLNNNWQYTFLNDAALVDHPEGREAALGRSIWDVHPELNGTLFSEKYREAFEERKVVEFESFYPPFKQWFYAKVYPSADGLTIFYNNITERKVAEQEITSEKLLSDAIINSLPGIFYLYNKNGNFIRWNKNFERVSGYNEEEFKQLQPLDFYDNDEKEKLSEKIGSVFANGYDEVEAHLLTKDKQKIPYYFNGYRLTYNNEEFLLGTGIDISQRKMIENELKQSEEKYRLLFHNSPISMWMLSIPDYKIIDVNDSAINKYGYTREEFSGNAAKSFLTPKQWNSFKEQTTAPQLKTENAFQGKWKHRKKNGELVIAEIVIHNLNYADKQVCVVLANDITDREKAERELRASEARLADAQSVAKIGSWETDLKTQHVVWSAETYRIFELEKTDRSISHALFLEYVHPEDREKVDHAFTTYMHTHDLHSIEHRIVTPSGRVKTVEECWRTVFDSKGNPLKAVGTCQDISARKKAEELIRKSQQELRQLSAHLQTIREEERTGIAREIHDELGQQLTGLKMDASWLTKKLKEEDTSLKEKLSSMISLINETIKTVRRIASDLRPGILDDLGLVAALEWQSQEFEKRSGIRVRFTAESPLWQPEKDLATTIFRIYQETLTNIARHAKAREISTRLQKKEKEIYLVIKDDGIGFDTDEVKQKKSLGLLGMRERALLFSGVLNIESEKGKGTVVTLKIPILNQINLPA